MILHYIIKWIFKIDFITDTINVTLNINWKMCPLLIIAWNGLEVVSFLLLEICYNLVMLCSIVINFPLKEMKSKRSQKMLYSLLLPILQLMKGDTFVLFMNHLYLKTCFIGVSRWRTFNIDLSERKINCHLCSNKRQYKSFGVQWSKLLQMEMDITAWDGQ